MTKYDYLIVGAGISGAVFARKMSDAGKKCLVIDKRPQVGGNVYTRCIEDVIVHCYGAHIFHTSDEEVWRFVNEYAEFNDFINSPLAQVGDKRYHLPFNMNTFSEFWGVKTPEEAIEKINSTKPNSKAPSNLEEQALSMVGEELYKAFIKGYTEKQWGRPCNELPPDIIKRIPLRFTFDNDYFTDKYQGIPIGGYTPMILKMLKGADVLLNVDFCDKEIRESMLNIADKIYYTGAIDGFFDYKSGYLQYRTLRFETEVLPQRDFQGNAVINYPDIEVPYTRIIEHKHFEFGQQKDTVITREYSAEWNKDSEPYYPINTAQNQALYAKYRKLAENNYPNVIFGGRLGLYQYLNMDVAVKLALETAEKELKRADF